MMTAAKTDGECIGRFEGASALRFLVDRRSGMG
jgi:hypothetical protein